MRQASWEVNELHDQTQSTPWLFFCSLCLRVCSLSGSHNEMRLTVQNETLCCCLTCVRATERATYSWTRKSAGWLGLYTMDHDKQLLRYNIISSPPYLPYLISLLQLRQWLLLLLYYNLVLLHIISLVHNNVFVQQKTNPPNDQSSNGHTR
jgi:hypothetical protein